MRQFLKDSSVFSASRYLILGLGFIRNLVIAKFLSPADYGSWVIITLILTYGDQIHLGLRHVGDKEIPYRRGRGEETTVFTNIIYGGVIFFSLSVFLLLTILAVIGSWMDAALRTGLLITGFIIVADQVNRFYYMLMRAHHEFVFASKVESLFELLRTLLVAVGVIVFKFQGALAGMAIGSLLLTLYLNRQYRGTYWPHFHRQHLITLLRLSLPLFVNGLLFILLSSLDRLVAATTLSPHELGLYGLVALLVAIPFNATQAVGFVIYPRLSEQFGRHGKVQELERFFSHILRLTVHLVPPIVAGAFLIAPCVITGFLPAYIEAIPAVFVLMPGVYFFAIVQLPTAFLVAAENNRWYIAVEITTILLLILSYFVGLQIERNFITIAAVTAMGFFLYATMLLVICYRILEHSLGSIVKTIGKVYAPFFFSIIVIYILLRFFPYPATSQFRDSLFWSLRQLAIFVVAYGALFYWFNWRSGYWKRLRAEVTT
ncbi:MAG: oligosaccharide flippase family protein [candidate division KSB1 bacterium]|nr:oligosaccharide flippase family protein [candidate division KSB1 bacterium]MDZ7301017.1 oligosaccharide flippase family protein [candidate division KSB1 bacterium]